MQIKQIFTPTLVSFALLLGLASSASAVEVIDGCAGGIPASADIDILTATFDDVNDKITVVLDLCGATDSQTKYRIHLDHTAPFAGDSPIDCRGDSNPDSCCTTSDDTMKTRVHTGSSKDTGPGMITINGDMITYMVTLAELGLDPQQGDTKVLIWADTQFKGISDQAPNTDWGNGCAKPESLGEVLELSLDPDKPDKIVFVTSGTFTAILGGLAGADANCNAAATAGSLPGTYTAWLSDRDIDARDRIFNSDGPYVRTDGVRVADDFTDLIDCTTDCLQNPINRTANDITLGGAGLVWTATNVIGTSFLGRDCFHWTSIDTAGGAPAFGFHNATNVAWTFAGGGDCVLSAHLYCFQDE